MAQFGGMELTNGGRTLIAKAIGGQVLKFTKGVAGDGYLPRDHDVSEMTRIIHPIREMEIETIYIDKNASSHFRPLRDSFRIYGRILRSAGSFSRGGDGSNNKSAE